MILGYSCQRPKKENYIDFQSKLVKGLKGLEIKDLSLMFFGSFVRGDYNPGRSDIDAALEFPDEVVINKKNLSLCSKVIKESLEGNHIPFQVSVCDRATSEDGRFNTYTYDFKKYFEEEGVILLGNDFRNYMKFELKKSGDLHSISFNLKKSRFGLLFSQYNLKWDYEKFLKDFTKTLDSASRGSKQIFNLIEGNVYKNRFSAIEKIKVNFPEVDIWPIKKIKELYTEPSKLDLLYRKPKDILVLWSSALTTFEQIIRSYIRKYPR